MMEYAIEDRDDASTAESMITITVVCNQRPTANDDYASTDEDDPVDIDVIDNDTDPEDDDIKVNEITEDPKYEQCNRYWTMIPLNIHHLKKNVMKLQDML